MLFKNYTAKQKYNHIYRHWRKDDLIDFLDSCLADIGCSDEEFKIYLDMTQNLKTKKAILNKYLDLVWELILEEYSYAY